MSVEDTPEDAPAVEFDGVSVSLGDTRVLSGVDLSVEPGTFLGLIGPNGAGKTTLLRTANGILDPGGGVVTVAGEDVHAVSSTAASRLVATVPQESSPIGLIICIAAISKVFTMFEKPRRQLEEHESCM